MLDERWIRSLHVEAMRRGDLHAERDPHVLFQASTIGALLDGAFDGDLSFAELAEHGDLGLGTLNRLDGEMIALDGEFFRADVDGAIERDPRAGEDAVRGGDEVRTRGRRADRGAARAGGSAGPDRSADSRRRPLLRDPPRRPLRAGPGPLGPGPEPALPAPGRGRRRPARLRARGRRRDDAGLPLSRLRRGDRGRRLPPAFHQRRPHSRRPCARLARRRGTAGAARSLQRPACRAAARRRPRPIPTWRARPTRQSFEPRAADPPSSGGRPARSRWRRPGGSRGGPRARGRSGRWGRG